MDDSAHSPTEVLFLAGTVERWNLELREVVAEIEALVARRDRVQERLEHARKLLDLVKQDARAVTAPPKAAPTPKTMALLNANPQLPLTAVELPTPQGEKESWVGMVRRWVNEAPLGLTFPELRDKIEKDADASSRFRASEKGYYNALSRLAQRGEIIRENGRVFSPAAHAAFKREVEAGRVDGTPPPPANTYSPMGEAILDIVASRPGILGKDILHELRTDSEFNATLTPHNSGAYNIIARLVRRKQLIRRDDGQCFLGPKAPPRDRNSKWLNLQPAESAGVFA